MPIVAAKPLSGYPWFIQLFFWKQERTYGRILEPGLLWGRSPWVFAAVALLYGALDRRSSPLSPALRSLVTVRVSQINHCAFCVDINSATLAKRGVSMDKINALVSWRESLLFSPEERLALEYAEAMTVTGDGVSNELRERLKKLVDGRRHRRTHRADCLPEPFVKVQRCARRAFTRVLHDPSKTMIHLYGHCE